MRRIGLGHFEKTLLWRIGLAQPVGGELDGLDDLAIARAAADIAGNRLDDIFARRLVVMTEQRMRGQDHARRAVAALQTMRLAEGVLHDAELSRSRRQPFDRRDLVPVGLNREHQAGARRLAIEQHRAGAAHAMLTAGMTSHQQEILAERVEHRLARLDIDLARLSVDVELHLHCTVPPCERASAKASSSARVPNTAATRWR